MKRKAHFAAHFAGFAVLIAFGAAPVCGAASASVSGLVRDSAGVPQIGAEVQLLRPDLSVVASVYTNSQGRFIISSILPGRYALKAMGMSFLPSLRENVRVRAGTIVNLTLNTLYEVMQWLPAEPRAANSQKDDWAWTLRSAANRPLLRWLEDGPLVVVSDGSGASAQAEGPADGDRAGGTFGESGERFSPRWKIRPPDSRELLARVDFAPDTDAGMESMLGFRQDLGFAGSVQSVAAVAVHPEMDGPAGKRDWTRPPSAPGRRCTWAMSSRRRWARPRCWGVSPEQSPNTVAAALPYASVDWRDGNSSVGYRVATLLPGPIQSDETQAGAWLPELSLAQWRSGHRARAAPGDWLGAEDRCLGDGRSGLRRQDPKSGAGGHGRTLPAAIPARRPLPRCLTVRAACCVPPGRTSPARESRPVSSAACPAAIMSASAMPTATRW